MTETYDKVETAEDTGAGEKINTSYLQFFKNAILETKQEVWLMLSLLHHYQ